MECRRALAVAGSLTITALAGAIAAGASTGLFGFGTAGVASPTDTSVPAAARPAPRVVEVTVPAPTKQAAARSGTSARPTSPPAAAPSLAPAVTRGAAAATTDDPDEHQEIEDGDHEDQDDHEDGDHEDHEEHENHEDDD